MNEFDRDTLEASIAKMEAVTDAELKEQSESAAARETLIQMLLEGPLTLRIWRERIALLQRHIIASDRYFRRVERALRKTKQIRA